MFEIKPLWRFGTSETITTLLSVLLPLLTVLVVVGLLFVLPAKTKKQQRITVLVIAGLVFALYVFKVAFTYVRTVTINDSTVLNITDLIKIFGLDIKMFLTFACVATLVMSAFCKRENKTFSMLAYTMLAIAMPLAIISLFNPKLVIDVNNRWYHALNIANMLINASFILAPLYLVKTTKLSLSYKHFWKGICMYVIMLCLCMTLCLVFKVNISELTNPTTLKNLGMKVDFPWNLAITIPVFLILAIGIYLLVGLISKYLDKYLLCRPEDEIREVEVEQPKNDFFDLYAFATKSIACMQGVLILAIMAVVFNSMAPTYLGLLCLIPLLMTVFCLFAIFEMEKLAVENDETIFEKNSTKSKKFLVYVLLGDVFFGLTVLKQFKNEKNAIEERKIREEKRKFREQQAKQNANKKV